MTYENSTLSLRFNGNLQVNPGQPEFIEAKDGGGGGDNWR